MLTPSFLQTITEWAEKRTERLNEKLAQKIAERIIAQFERTGGVELIPASRKDMLKMLNSGLTTEEVSSLVERYTPSIKEAVRDAFWQAGAEIAKDNDDFTRQVVDKEVELSEELKRQEIELPEATDYEKVGVPEEARDLGLTQKEARLLERAYKVTLGEIDNLTGTTAIQCQQTFIEACNEAYWDATHGVSINEAIREAIDKAAQAGAWVEYPSGHRDRVEVAVARAVRTGINQAAGDITLARCAEMGVGHVVVSSHRDARTTDKDEPANHASWQGKVYALNWTDPALQKYGVTPKEEEENKKGFRFLKAIKDFFARFRKKAPQEEYPDFVTVTGYGTGPGLCGWNCRHSFTPFYPGVNTNNQQQYDQKETAKAYELTQQQRKLERKIREARREVQAMRAARDAATDEDQARVLTDGLTRLQDRLQEMEDAYVDFCKDNGLKTMQERLYVPRNVDLSGDSDIINHKNGALQQEDREGAIPEALANNYDDYEELTIDETEKELLKELRELSDSSGYEYGAAILDGKAEEPFTDNLPDKVHVPQKYLSGEKPVKLYHAHTNYTILSGGDFKLLAENKIDRIVVITKAGEVFSASVGSGVIPTTEEFQSDDREALMQAYSNIQQHPQYHAWSGAERWYALIREKAYLLARLYGWNLEGGHYDAL